MLKTGSSSVEGEDEQWKVAPLDRDILRRTHADDSGDAGGDGGRLLVMSRCVRRRAKGGGGGGMATEAMDGICVSNQPGKMQMTRKMLVWNLTRGLLVDSEQFPVAYDSPVPIDMKPQDLRFIETGADVLTNGSVRLLDPV
jgi:hypothetical protein